ncbi:hypothetical protein Q1J55_01720 [Pseudomonas syringae]|uniref:hypothetical protein n=1 Tax=Pseudomonas syringae TaxID=317 RepID=UPI0034D72CAF
MMTGIGLATGANILKKSDFVYDQDEFRRDIWQAINGYRNACESFAAIVEHWRELASKFLDGQLTIEGSAGQVSGDFAGRSFTINLLPLLLDEKIYALAFISAKNPLSGETSEVGRFLIGAQGNIFSEYGEELLKWETDDRSYRLLISVTRKVLQHSFKTQ